MSLAEKGGLDFVGIMQSAADDFVSYTHNNGRLLQQLNPYVMFLLCMIHSPHHILKADFKGDKVMCLTTKPKKLVHYRRACMSRDDLSLFYYFCVSLCICISTFRPYIKKEFACASLVQDFWSWKVAAEADPSYILITYLEKKCMLNYIGAFL